MTKNKTIIINPSDNTKNIEIICVMIRRAIERMLLIDRVTYNIHSIKNIQFNKDILPIREFRLDWLVPDASMCIIGKRCSGKSWLCRDITHHINKQTTIISCTDHINRFYSSNFPNATIHQEYNKDIIVSLLQNIDSKLLVMEDCMAYGEQRTRYENFFTLIHTNRYHHLAYILTMQFPLNISLEHRSKFEYIFLFKEDFRNNQKRLYNRYANMFPNFNSFMQVFSKLTKDHGCMVIHNGSSYTDLSDRIFWFKAKNPLQ